MSTCEKCGIERQWLHKHHVKPQHLGGTDADGTLRLCANCHEDIHGGPFGGVTRGRLANTPEARAKKGKKSKAMWADPVIRERIMSGRRAVWHLRDNKTISDKVHAYWTPEKREERRLKIIALRAERGSNWGTNAGKIIGPRKAG